MNRLIPRLAALALATACLVPAALAEDAGAIRRALAAAGAKDWTGAETAARQSGPIATDLVLWQRLRAGQGTWPDYRDFAARNPDWPGMELLFRRGEALLRPDLPAGEVLAWFGERLPETLNGATAWIAAQPENRRAEAAARFWTHSAALDAAGETAFLAAHGAAVADHHPARLQALLDAGEWAAAERMLPRVTGPLADLARARIAVQARRPGVDPLILALPEDLRNDAGLALDRFRWRVAARQGDLARQLMLERSTGAEALRDPAAWASLRRDYAREALRKGDWALAERFAASHFLPQGDSAAVDLDWIAGYAALRAGAPDRAATHFARLPVADYNGITVARTHYWQGRAAEALGDQATARAAYERAAAHQTAYYGQLAAERIGAPMQPALAVTGPAVETLPDWRNSALSGNRLFQAGLWLIVAGEPAQAQRFFLHLAQTAAPEDIARMGRVMLELRRPWDALRLSKAAAAKGGVYPALHYPLTGLEGGSFGLPPELVMAIARQESEFNHTVQSPVGARGLMQVMPDTARQMAGVVGEAFELARLTRDGGYNARLGAAYLEGLRNRFGNSVALVAAGYNAGPGRSARWLRDFGDLRDEGVDPVDWVEMIPFDETRNYVMRVAEALPIYRARIAGHTVPFVPSWDLRGGVSKPQRAEGPLMLALSARPPAPPAWVAQAANHALRLAMATDPRAAAQGIAAMAKALSEATDEAPRPEAQIAAVAQSLDPPRVGLAPAPQPRPATALPNAGAEAAPATEAGSADPAPGPVPAAEASSGPAAEPLPASAPEPVSAFAWPAGMVSGAVTLSAPSAPSATR
ncbi:lytic transglycosylase domain-containing protein [Paracoccus chinensis]|uniref:Soluble lytic murein transglycosylase n=1 Tax=Paracoccus chinensis TaxID=525640 RepID=A0A1G9FS08_9RHOB|nr:lytic transglycosylase domain-containing protein [Paracoccus chinensis]SDK91201.1 soluble lytic murein transglycosylase [Paracoccus chinensis]